MSRGPAPSARLAAPLPGAAPPSAHSQDDASELRWRTAQKWRGRPPLGEVVTTENLGDLASVRRPAQKAQQGDQPAAWRCGPVHSGLDRLPPAGHRSAHTEDGISTFTTRGADAHSSGPLKETLTA